MFTVAFVLDTQPGVDRATALQRWRTTHADLVRQVPGVRRYVQQHATGAPEGGPPFLGVASLSFDTKADVDTAAASAQFGAAVADIANFAGESLPTAFTDDVVMVA